MRLASSLLGAALFLAACSRGAPAPGPSPTPSAGASAAPAGGPTSVPIRFNEYGKPSSPYIYITEQKRNRIVYTMRADSGTGIHISEGSGRSDFVNPHITFHEEGKRTLVVDGPHATVLERDRSVVMTGGTHARNNEGMTLKSDTLRYDDGAEMLYGQGNVLITTAQNEQLRGQRFDYNLRTTEIHVTGDGR
jgi:LPS export ABC transporter protein LptC